MKEVLFIGLEVDDQAFHGYGVSKDGSERFEFSCRPHLADLAKKLSKFESFDVWICYEATYLGFSLQRGLQSKGYHCDVIAPSLIPREPGRQVKTDRVDSRKLARYYKQGLLTVVQPPDKVQEAQRDLIRSRSFLSSQVRKLKAHINSLCRRSGLDYRSEVGKPGSHYWTQPHYQWLERKASIHRESLGMNLELLLMTLRQLSSQVASYDEQINKLASTERYGAAVRALGCFRGISTLTAMKLITEIGDINRFAHPRQLTSYSGMDIREYSSGASERRYSITHMGNRHIRTAVVEACQTALKPPRISNELKRRRQGASAKAIDVADRCMKRLSKKGLHLVMAGKPKNKATVACAREMLGFVWESLKAVS